MHIQKNVIVIVDATFTGKYYAPAFKGLGYECIHVNTKAAIPKKFQKFNQIDLSCYEENIQSANIAEIINKLKKYNIKAIIAGSETAVNATDEIADSFAVLKNDVATTALRRNKYFMIEALRKKNIPCALQYKSNNVVELIDFFEKLNFEKVILKPTLASSSEGVSICKNKEDIRNNFKEFFKKRNNEGEVNKEFVIQELLMGDEFIIDSVSCKGQHLITGVWKRIGDNENIIATNQYIDLISNKSQEFQILKEYTKLVLDAVGIENGPAHSEVKLTQQGPKLIETGARLSGIDVFSTQYEAQGYSQLSCAVEAYINPELFLKEINLYENLPQKAMRIIIFSPTIEGKINRNPNLLPLLKLSTIKSIEFLFEKDDFIKKNKYIFDRPGYAMMLAETPEEFENDYNEFRRLEKKLYQDILEPVNKTV